MARHARRGRELLGNLGAPCGDTLGIAPESLAAVVVELEGYTPACWHTSRAPVVRTLDATLRLMEERPRP